MWKSNKHKSLIHITEIGGNFISFIGFKQEVYPNGRVVNEYYENSFGLEDPRYTDFIKIYIYLGKSKANINELFEI